MARFRWLAVAVAAVLSFLALPAPSASAAGEFATTVPDGAYRTCITQKLGLAADADPTAEQLSSITELSCTGKGIADATGTSALPNLTKLFLDGNQLSDLKPLAGATKILSLGLGNNKISNIAALASLTRLQAVKLNGNQIRDFSVLSALPGYSSGSSQLYGQAITVDAALGVPARVPTVIGDQAEIVPVYTAPDGVTAASGAVTYPTAGDYAWVFKNDSLYLNATVTVHVTDSGVTIPDAALRACLNSRIGNTDTTVQPTVAQLAALTGALTCTGKGVKDLTGLNLATGLTAVNITDNSVSDLSPIAGLPNLSGKLTLSRNEVTSLSALGSSPVGQLEILQTVASAAKAKLVSLAGVNKLTGLTALTISQQAVSSLAPLAGHPRLLTLTATNNRITDVSPLASIGTLTSASVDKNQIADLSGLKGKTLNTLNAKDQILTAAEATAGTATTAPSVTRKDGTTLVATPPAGVTTTSGTVTYAASGSYAWTFSGGDGTTGNQFTGTITQSVRDAAPPVVEVAVPDANFKACLNTALKQDATATITEDQAKTLTDLSCIGSDASPGARIADLTGAEKLTNLTELVLSTNAITDVTPLAGLTKLTRLYLPGNAITDPSALASLTGLDELLLSYNPISSISALAPLVNLTNLEVTQKHPHTGADLTSLDGVQGMTRLTRLVANNSSLTSLEPVKGLSALKKLYVSNNTITDLTPVKGLTELTGLGAFSNRIADVTPLAGLTRLTDVDLEYNRIADLSALGGLTSLGYLGLKAQGQVVTATSVPAQFATTVPNPRTNTGAAATLTAPEGVTVTDGKVRYPAEGSYSWTFSAKDETSNTEFFSGTITQPVTAAVSGAAGVPDASLRSCLAQAAGLAASDVPTEAELAAVTSADCSDRGITDLTGADLLTGAEALDLSGNPLTGLAPLAGLDRLTRLDLSDTGLTSVKALAGLTGLTTLSLNGNHLKDLAPLGGLTGLATLGASGQILKLPDTQGGVVVDIPSVSTPSGATVAASLPDGATAAGSGATFRRAGTYRWPFAAGSFSGSFVQVVTSDVAEPDAQAGASSCVAAGRVWVVVERDTGLQQGGCATKFATGLEALTSAGFSPTGTGFVTAIDGYPAGKADSSYWSYWHASDPVAADGSTRYSWSYSSLGAADYAPKAGGIEGWRFESWQTKAVAPSWTPVVATASTPTPAPAPTPTPTPAPAPAGTVKTSVSAKKVAVTYGKKATVVVTTTPHKAGGTVQVTLGERTVSAKVVKGKARLSLPARSLRPGSYRLSLSYPQHGSYRASGTTLRVSVAKARPTVKVSAQYQRTTRVLSVTVRVSSGAATPTGYVRFALGDTIVRVFVGADGRARATFAEVEQGRRTVQAWYSGSDLLTSRSGKARVAVRR